MFFGQDTKVKQRNPWRNFLSGRQVFKSMGDGSGCHLIINMMRQVHAHLPTSSIILNFLLDIPGSKHYRTKKFLFDEKYLNR